jgi:hypothetical protein
MDTRVPGGKGSGFRSWVGFVAHEATGESTMETNGFREACDWEAPLVEFVDSWSIVLLGNGIVEQDSVCLFVSTNGNTI